MSAGDVYAHRGAAHSRRERPRDERRGRTVVRARHDPEHHQKREQLPVRARRREGDARGAHEEEATDDHDSRNDAGGEDAPRRVRAARRDRERRHGEPALAVAQRERVADQGKQRIEERVRDVMREMRRGDRPEQRLTAAFLEGKLLDTRLGRDRQGLLGDRGHDTSSTGAFRLAWYAAIVAIGGRPRWRMLLTLWW